MNMTLSIILMSLLCFLLTCAECLASLSAQGVTLQEDEKTVQIVSVNRWDLLFEYVAEAWPGLRIGGSPKAEYSVSAARKDLDDLARLNLKVLRVSATLYWSTPMKKTFYEDSKRWWSAFEQMLDDCDQRGIRLVLLLNHHSQLFPDLGHESRQDFFRNRDSVSRQLHDNYIREVVSRFRNRKTLYFWEIANELNLGENLAFHDPEGLKHRDHLVGMETLMNYPIVRSASNHYTTQDTVNYMRETAELIRTLDQKHLIGSGHSTPRPAAMHLWRAQQTHGRGDWTQDSLEENIEYIRLIHPDPVDLISIHYYEDAQKLFGGELGNLENIATLMAISREIGKPLYLGEIGTPSREYASEESLAWLSKALEMIRKEAVPLTLFWTWNDPGRDLFLNVGQTDKAIEIISNTAAQPD